MTEPRYIQSARKNGKRFAIAQQIAARCGLSVEATFELLNAGWAYEERLHELSRWVAPDPFRRESNDSGTGGTS